MKTLIALFFVSAGWAYECEYAVEAHGINGWFTFAEGFAAKTTEACDKQWNLCVVKAHNEAQLNSVRNPGGRINAFRCAGKDCDDVEKNINCKSWVSETY